MKEFCSFKCWAAHENSQITFQCLEWTSHWCLYIYYMIGVISVYVTVEIKSITLSEFILAGFITDGNSKLVGNARLRQVRVKTNSCDVAHSLQQSVPDCHAPYSWELEDMGSYGPGWSHPAGGNASLNLQGPWTYQSQRKLRAYPIWGSVKLYRGGGFVVDLGPDLQNSSR